MSQSPDILDIKETVGVINASKTIKKGEEQIALTCLDTVVSIITRTKLKIKKAEQDTMKSQLDKLVEIIFSQMEKISKLNGKIETLQDNNSNNAKIMATSHPEETPTYAKIVAKPKTVFKNIPPKFVSSIYPKEEEISSEEAKASLLKNIASSKINVRVKKFQK
ncbi:hypothetical protein HNY73_023107 [Argiope bruennichi]|uniref:Uncharacterized protein n=1 Tax=Argiope bruennichi TaxID=94029 RepID=A0A8T0E3V7_ARGBR|nr:hypothetical protein HNY73_023107 [Argiope bruennichi]